MQISFFQTGGRWRGSYDPEETYSVNDIVSYLGVAYKSNSSALLGVTPVDGSDWTKIISTPEPDNLEASAVEEASAITVGTASGTRKYWFGQEWALEKMGPRSVNLKKVYQNCNCNCNCVSNCNCVANQPNEANCSYDSGDGNACNCACLFQTNCNYASGNCNCTPNCNDGNCYY